MFHLCSRKKGVIVPVFGGRQVDGFETPKHGTHKVLTRFGKYPKKIVDRIL